MTTFARACPVSLSRKPLSPGTEATSKTDLSLSRSLVHRQTWRLTGRYVFMYPPVVCLPTPRFSESFSLTRSLASPYFLPTPNSFSLVCELYQPNISILPHITTRRSVTPSRLVTRNLAHSRSHPPLALLGGAHAYRARESGEARHCAANTAREGGGFNAPSSAGRQREGKLTGAAVSSPVGTA